MKVLKDFSSKVIYLRKVHHMPQSVLAEKLDVDVHTVSNWEKGKTRPGSIGCISKLSKIFKVPADFFVSDDKAAFIDELLANSTIINKLELRVKALEQRTNGNKA